MEEICYDIKTNKCIWRYVNLLHCNSFKPPICFDHFCGYLQELLLQRVCYKDKQTKVQIQTIQSVYVVCYICISVCLCKEKATSGTNYSKYISSTSTCFGRIQVHHQEVQPYVYNYWYLFFLDDLLLSWLDWTIQPGQHTVI